VPLSPSSRTWYQSKGGCLATGEYRHYGLCVGGRLQLCDTNRHLLTNLLYKPCLVFSCPSSEAWPHWEYRHHGSCVGGR